MSDPQRLPTSAFKKFIQGVVGLGVSPECWAKVEAELFFDILENQTGIRWPLITETMRERVERHILERVQRILLEE